VSGFLVSVNGDGAPVDPALLRRMIKAMIHRGPNALRSHALGGAGIGHVLNVVSTDPSHDAEQFFVGDNLWLSGDFRLDGREALISVIRNKRELVADDSSDGALLLAAYRAFGKDCVRYLRGDFAFALWDLNKKRLLLARDQFGIKPLFYACRNDSLSAASSVDALRMLPFVSDELDDQAMAEFLCSGLFMSLGASAFADIRRLPPAHALTFENGVLRSWRYWSLPVAEEIHYRNAAQYLEQFRELMQRSIDDRLTGDSVGLHLSGGMDSAVIAATVKNSAKQVRMRGYSVVFDHLIPDQERRFASATAEHLRFPVEFMSADGFLPYARWSRTPEPIHDPFFFNQRTQYRDLVTHSRVALSGHGGDELMLGSYVADLFGRLPSTRIAKDLIRPEWIRGELPQRFDLARRVRELTSDWVPSAHPIRHQAFRQFSSPIWPAILEQEDANFTGFPVEVRYPFFDLRLVEFLLALPPLPWCVNKHLSRQAMANLLPEAVRKRRKAPVSEDVLTAHLRARGSRPVHAVSIPPALNCYIDNDKLPPVEGLLSSADRLWLRMAPVSLGLWLEHNGFGTGKSRNTTHETVPTQRQPVCAREATLS
jgi:asparagine synthase (glutamine-hydrolysing)